MVSPPFYQPRGVRIEAELIEKTKPGDAYITHAPTGHLRAWWGRARVPVWFARWLFSIGRPA